jgi:hypothetical protein
MTPAGIIFRLSKCFEIESWICKQKVEKKLNYIYTALPAEPLIISAIFHLKIGAFLHCPLTVQWLCAERFKIKKEAAMLGHSLTEKFPVHDIRDAKGTF